MALPNPPTKIPTPNNASLRAYNSYYPLSGSLLAYYIIILSIVVSRNTTVTQLKNKATAVRIGVNSIKQTKNNEINYIRLKPMK